MHVIHVHSGQSFKLGIIIDVGVVTRVFKQQVAIIQLGKVKRGVGDGPANDRLVAFREVGIPVFGFHDAHPQELARLTATRGLKFAEDQDGSSGLVGRKVVVTVYGCIAFGVADLFEYEVVFRVWIQGHWRRIYNMRVV